MARLKIMGSKTRLERIFRDYPNVKVEGGHTTVTFEPGTESEQDARAIYASLVTLHRFTPLNTTVADVPTKAPVALPASVTAETEYTFIPQFAGG